MQNEDLVQLIEIQQALAQRFPVEDHRERVVPGGGRWWFVSWQSIRARIDQVAPFANISYSQPIYIGDYCSITCTIEILGVHRQGVGNAKIQELNISGKDVSRGSPIERACADAFKQAAENFGVCRYLDDQADDRTKNSFRVWMQQNGNGKPLANYQAEQSGTPPRSPSPPKRQYKPGGSPIAKRSISAAPAQPPDPTAPTANQDRLRSLFSLMGIRQGSQLAAAVIQRLYPGKMAIDLTEPELRSVRNGILIEYARSQFPESVPNTAIVQWFVGLDDALPDEELAQRWLQLIREKLAKEAIG
jgi:hypothetical protein